MTPALLRACGQALYGQQWQAPLSRDLDVALRTVLRWAAGEFGMPAGIAGELRALLVRRGVDIAELAARLPAGNYILDTTIGTV